ncbi:hypothetical protein DNTS_020262 [Danionella cerebrum]|uniref:SOGA 1/2-like coiled-coil domain-containing protein n=1 Tax=Danionella cerebrum TaxID=2873325 RepID=A0A553MKL9_9TELE|nr:hypothetical protein DNTS_020262 [Danionella translucida]
MWSAFGNGSSAFGSKAQGWEFVPGSRLKKNPARVRSFPSALLEQQLPPGASGNEATPNQELPSPHLRLKKKFEELKTRYDLDREQWRMEKEMLLRQGGENRRMLLELKCVLEEVQRCVKREERKRNDLELQYMKDQGDWELERSELKSRISQLEAKGCDALRRVYPGETLQRERAEQKKLLAFTHTTAMDLHCRLEESEREWASERAELIERFERERSDWEMQIQDMQSRIQELYNEVKVHRSKKSLRPITEGQFALRLSSSSASTLSSAPTYPSEANIYEYPEALTQQSNASITSQPSQLSHDDSESSDTSRNDQNYLKIVAEQQAVDITELEEILENCRREKVRHTPVVSGQDELLKPFRPFQSMDITCGSDKKNNTALNAALKEIALVSEELCSFQDDTRKLPDIKRSQSDSTFFLSEPGLVERVKDNLEMEDTVLYLKNMSEDLKSLDEQYWTNRECDNLHQEIRRQAPAIPVRSTSWYVSSPVALETEGSEAEHGCKWAGSHSDRKYTSPAIVRKFEAMLQENEGKILTDSGSITTNNESSVSHSRWSCDASRLGSNKQPRFGSVKRCLSNIDIAPTATDPVNQCGQGIRDKLKSASYHTPTDAVVSENIAVGNLAPGPVPTDSSTPEKSVSPYSRVSANLTPTPILEGDIAPRELALSYNSATGVVTANPALTLPLNTSISRHNSFTQSKAISTPPTDLPMTQDLASLCRNSTTNTTPSGIHRNSNASQDCVSPYSDAIDVTTNPVPSENNGALDSNITDNPGPTVGLKDSIKSQDFVSPYSTADVTGNPGSTAILRDSLASCINDTSNVTDIFASSAVNSDFVDFVSPYTSSAADPPPTAKQKAFKASFDLFSPSSNAIGNMLVCPTLATNCADISSTSASAGIHTVSHDFVSTHTNVTRLGTPAIPKVSGACQDFVLSYSDAMGCPASTAIVKDSIASQNVFSPNTNATANLASLAIQLNAVARPASRNERLEQKTAEFNRTLFQTGMGLHCNEDLAVKLSTEYDPEVLSKNTFSGSASKYIEDSLELMLSDLAAECPNEKLEKDLISFQQGSCSQETAKRPFQVEPSTLCLFDQIGLHFQIQTEKKYQDANPDDQEEKQPKLPSRDRSSTRSRILEENPWKPSTLAAYPRPVESRSNYGAVERILRSYEERLSLESNHTSPSPGKKEGLVDLLEILNVQQESNSTQNLICTPQKQITDHKETHVKVQQCTVSLRKSFSRPACPAKRRLPSRWANRSSTSSASSPSPSPPPSTAFVRGKTHSYSSFHTETVI